MGTVTQMYVSVDAATPQKLKQIDRPLFRDYWERFVGSLEALKSKRQRTVYRLTLVGGGEEEEKEEEEDNSISNNKTTTTTTDNNEDVKKSRNSPKKKNNNMAEVNEYASLIRIGEPDLIEVKGVTFCGNSKGYELRMSNVPFHDEVVKFCTQLCAAIEAQNKNNNDSCNNIEYGLACEHEHSLCVLLARKDKFFINNRWHTWIDYEKFHDLVASGREEFGSEDYVAPTPSWAVFGSTEAGFDPQETRFRKVKAWKRKQLEEMGVEDVNMLSTKELSGVVDNM